MRVGKIEGATGVNASKDAKIFHIADVVIATDARTDSTVWRLGPQTAHPGAAFGRAMEISFLKEEYLG